MSKNADKRTERIAYLRTLLDKHEEAPVSWLDEEEEAETRAELKQLLAEQRLDASESAQASDSFRAQEQATLRRDGMASSMRKASECRIAELQDSLMMKKEKRDILLGRHETPMNEEAIAENEAEITKLEKELSLLVAERRDINLRRLEQIQSYGADIKGIANELLHETKEKDSSKWAPGEGNLSWQEVDSAIHKGFTENSDGKPEQGQCLTAAGNEKPTGHGERNNFADNLFDAILGDAAGLYNIHWVDKRDSYKTMGFERLMGMLNVEVTELTNVRTYKEALDVLLVALMLAASIYEERMKEEVCHEETGNREAP